MKILGVTCGRKNSNTEILVKEALMGAEEAGAEVELVRLHDLTIKPCTGCNSCVIDLFEKGGAGHCMIRTTISTFSTKSSSTATAWWSARQLMKRAPAAN